MRSQVLVPGRLRGTWFAPSLSAITLLALAMFGLGYPERLLWVPLALFILFCSGLLAMLITAIGAFITKRWWQGVVQLTLCVLAGGGFLLVTGAALLGSFVPSDDHFADDLSIPEGIEIASTAGASNSAPADGFPEEHVLAPDADGFQMSLLEALGRPRGDDPAVSASLDALVSLDNQDAAILTRYLAANPAWRMFTENGSRYATRRWLIQGRWRYELHGYYSRSDVSTFGSQPDFQFRMTLGLSGKPWVRPGSRHTRLKPGQTAPLSLSNRNGMYESLLVIDAASDLVVEVFEQSKSPQRRLTNEALSRLQAELSPLAAAPQWETVRQLLPPGSIRQGKPAIELRESFQPGIYDVWIWANPGEPGMAYLKAFEVTKGTALSVERLKRASNEWIGWSDSPTDLFLSNTLVTIYEGDWGKPYAARFEVWFAPDRGGPERKLLERTFKIEGWQR